jgi:AcrR family transcriptional regulator
MASPKSTKERILDAAEMLFSKQGFAATSMRRITSAAGVNLAAVNYHFGSKAHLVEAVFERRLRPLNEERLVRLDRVLQHRAGVRDILDAFLGPALERLASVDEGDRQFIRLLARSHTDEMAGTERFMDRLYEPALRRFKEALTAALPEIPPAELMWRLHFVAGAVSYAMAGRDVIGIIRPDEANDADAMSRRLVPFLASALRTPMNGASDSGREAVA